MAEVTTLKSSLFPGQYEPGSRAPVDAARRVIDRPDAFSQQPFVGYLRGLFTRYGLENRDLDWARYSKYVVNERFYQGDQLGRLSQLNGQWRSRVLPSGKRDPRYVHNWIRGFSDGITTQHTLSETELTVVAIPDPGATDHTKGGAKTARRILDHYQSRLITEKFKQRESKLGQMTGQMVRYSYWDFRAGTGSTKRPQFEDQQVQVGQPVAQCLDCGEAHDPQQAMGAGCPFCGSQNLSQMGAAQSQLPGITGNEVTPIGDLCCLSIPAFQLKWDRTVSDFADSMYLRWRVRMRPERVKALIPWWRKTSDAGDHDDPGLRAERALQRGVGNTYAGTGWSGTTVGQGISEADTVVVDRWWLQPDAYCDYVFPVDVPLVDGTGFTAGKTAGYYFPDGLYVLMVNTEPLDFRAEDFRDHWDHTPVILVPSRIDGDSLLEDLIEPQKEVNDVKALQLANIKYVAGAGLMINPAAVNRDDVASKPFDIGIFKPGLPPEADMRNAIVPVPRMALSGEVYKYGDQQLQEMQQMSKQYPAVVGSQDPTGQSGTATGASLQSQAARSQRSPELALKAGYEAACGEKWLKLFQANATDEMYIPFKGKNGEAQGQWFKASDIPNNFAVSHRPRSYIPKNESDRRADIMALLQAVGGPQGIGFIASQLPELWEELQERFDVTVDITHADLVGHVCRIRIDVITEKAPMAMAVSQAIGNPQIGTQMLLSLPEVAVDPEEDHAAMIKWLQTWLMSDEAMDARTGNQMLIAAVHGQIDAHRQAAVAQAQQQQMAQIAAQAPMMQMQQQMQAQQQQQQMAQQHQQGQQQQAEQQAQQQQSAAEREHGAHLAEQKAQADHGRKQQQSLFQAAIQQAQAQNAATQPPTQGA